MFKLLIMTCTCLFGACDKPNTTDTSSLDGKHGGPSEDGEPGKDGWGKDGGNGGNGGDAI